MKALTLKARLVLFFAAFLSSGIMFAASGAPFKVTGQVTDESGETLIGVSVQTEGGKKIGQMTDIDGNYSITLDGPAELVFSYVGMEPVKVKVSGACVKNILMKASANVLDDVVVVGYGTQKKINLTGAVQNVTSDEILKRSVSNGANALQGIIPGLSAVQGSGAPGGDAASIKIRGLGSLNSSTSPLVLIDGVEGDMNRIDLNQVESISVLKDAASASIYGSRASNGVILVTTKRGAEGRVKVTFNGYVGWNKPTSLPKAVDAIGLMEAVDQANINNDQQPIYTDIIDIYRNEGPDYITYHDTNWRDAIIKSSAMVQNYSVGVSGGSENINVYASAGYYKQDGMVPNNQFQRTNLRLNSDMKINRFVKLGLDMSMRQAESISPIGGSNTLIGYALTFQPIWSGINADGTWGYGLQGNNPIATINDGGSSKSIAPEYIAKATLTITPFDGMTILGVYNYKRNDGETRTFADNFEEYEGGVFKGTYPSEVKSMREDRSKSIFKQFNVVATYENTFAKKHYLKAMAAFQSEECNFTSLTAARKDFKYDGYEDLNHGDASTATNGSSRYSWAMLSYIFRVNYSFDERYLIEVNGRYDGTSRFRKGERWGFFPSVSAGWRISQEGFWDSAREVMDNFKLRASYGRLGNQAITDSYFPYVSAIGADPTYGYWFDKQFYPGVAQVQLANPLITWEKSNQYDVGIDFGFFNSSLNGSVDFYVRHIDDMIQKFPVPEFVGMSSPWQNAGSMRNIGWELSLNWNDRVGDVSYFVRGNLSDVRNKVLDLYGLEYKSGNKLTTEGHPYGNWYGYIADGFYQSQEDIDNSPVMGDRVNVKPGFVKFRDISGPDGVPDGKIDGNDRTIIGNPSPRYEYGLTFGLDWKGIDFSAFFQGVGKKDVLYTGAGARPFLGNGTVYEYQLDTWSEDNRDAKFPLLLVDNSGGLNNNIASSLWVQSGAYCRLKNIVLGYTLPKKWTKKAMIERVRVYATAQNLFTIRGNNFYEGFDPEGSFGNSASCYPLNKTFLFGLNLDF